MNVLDIQNKLLERGILKDVDSIWYIASVDLIKMKDIIAFNNYCLAVIEGFVIDPEYKLLVSDHLWIGDVPNLSDFILITEDAWKYITTLPYSARYPNKPI